MIVTKRPKEKNLKIEYPYLGISKDDSTVVLFTRAATGMCVAPSHGSSKPESHVGEFHSLWHEASFTKYEGELILEN